ncbi:hypothetical protein [Stigmatella aurantiaca]|uniref:Conserved uncharacterized protein n=1 Tax=Stigmatella aurantiaca (strain DW4/3-1) TaxID=378806 RepID=Q098V2_STIAD|nr:hypothetical protein [Stigmatella aurantiaca]ADO75502.1 conserved uncharacterized protein [Stigmatella aurantiaca DW4/3-1]EAU68314.1 hypothetical protein STIAU_5857 [Stigmatella aurantiaca DW4/3-1]
MSEHRPEDDSIDDAGVERLRKALRDEDAAAGEPVDAERVWRAVTQDLPAEERRAVIERVAADPAWAQAWRLARTMSQAAAKADAPAKVLSLTDRKARGKRSWGGRPAWVAMAAMWVVLVGVVVVLRQQQQGEDPDRIRGGEAEAITAVVPDAAALPRDRFVLRWRGVAQATQWSVQVSSEDLKVFHRVERLEQREYTVPASVLAELPSGARVLWQVEARLPDGGVRRSSTFVNRLQ